MEINDTALSQRHDLTKINVAGSTQISKATTTIITKLTGPTSDDKPALIILTAKARYTNKLISIVEIAKRTLSTDGTNCFQYNALSSETVEMPRKPTESAVGDDEANESDDAFQNMGESMLSDRKKRAVPVMTTYLSASSIKELKAAHGYASAVKRVTVYLMLNFPSEQR